MMKKRELSFKIRGKILKIWIMIWMMTMIGIEAEVPEK